MSLEEKLGHKRQEQNQSTGLSTSEAINYSTRMSTIEHQNELIAQRIDQSVENIETNNKKIQENMNKTLEITSQNSQKLEEKIEELKCSQDVLLNSFNKSINGYFEQTITLIGKRFDERTDDVVTSFSDKVENIEKQFEQQSEKKVKNKKIIEDMKFIFANVFFVLIAIVLTRALFYGFWDGFNIKGLYAWGIQWNWLQYTMWGLFVAFIGTLIWAIFNFIKSNVSRYR